MQSEAEKMFKTAAVHRAALVAAEAEGLGNAVGVVLIAAVLSFPALNGIAWAEGEGV